jgi:putative DNA primase/helicase
MTSRNARNRGKRIAAPPETPDIAASLARIGWPVFPVTIYEDESGKRHKVPAVKWKDEATTDVATVHKWWAGEHSGRWIGVYCGKAGILVGDLDPRRKVTDPKTKKKRTAKAGTESLAEAGLDLPDTFTYPTQRKGGTHHVYAAPEGVELTIGADIIGPDGEKLEGVDVRAGSGLFVYYGPALKKAPRLAPAPDWLIVQRGERHNGGIDSAPGATEAEFRERLADGKPAKDLRRTIRGVEFPAGAAHEPMLEVVAALIGEGVKGTPGVLRLLDETRERYIEGGPDRARDWENAVAGSVRRFGLPPVSLALTKTEKAEITRRNSPEAIEERKLEKRAERVSRAVVDADDLSQDALAERFGDAIRDLWCNTTGLGLLHYEAGVWRVRDRAVLIDHARLFLRVIRAEQTRLAILRGDKPAEIAAKALGARGFITGVAELAAGALLADEPTLDDHPDLLNTPTGVVDLRTGELRPSDPALYFTKMTAAPYDPDADMSMWDRALGAIPPEVADWLQVRLGQAATGYTPDDAVLTIFEGSGENGKTTVLYAPREALGEGYAVTLSERVLLGDPSDHPTSMMTLQGARMAVVEELPEGRSLNVKRLKDTVGTPKITARKMRQDEVTFRATHGLFISTNYLPIVAETDHGTWRRLALVRFRETYLKPADWRRHEKAGTLSKRHHRGDARLVHDLAETPNAAVLRWLVEGARRWYENGRKMPSPPKRVRKDTEAWRLDADPVLAYVGERLTRDDRTAITSADLADDFNHWLERRGHRPWSQQTINSRFGGHVSMEGVERKTVKWSNALRPSRPANVLATKPIPRITTSWRGVRFVDDAAGYVKSEAEVDAETLADLERRARA